MIPSMKCSYSTICADQLLSMVLPEYCIDAPLACQLWESGANDTYRVRCSEEHYFLRIYRSGAFPREANEFEVDVLNHLHNQGIPVAYPIARRSGEYLTEIAAPEGPRIVLLNAVAPGSTPDYESLENCRLVGESVARLHLATTGFTSLHKRTPLELPWLLEDSLSVIRAFLAPHAEVLRVVDTVERDIRAMLQTVPKESLDIGICHGDLHGGNLHLHEGKVTHFDFEECASGYRIYDIATFKWGVCWGETRVGQWQAFMEGYEAVKSLSVADRSLVDTFVIIRELAELAYGIRHVRDFGRNDIMAADVEHLSKRLSKFCEEQRRHAQ